MECGVNIVDSNIDSIYRSVRIGGYVNTDNCRRFDRIGSQTCERGALFVFETLCMKILLIGWEKSGEEIGERKSGRGNQVEGLLAEQIFYVLQVFANFIPEKLRWQSCNKNGFGCAYGCR